MTVRRAASEEAILAEYKALRSEIEQLNQQMFIALTVTVTASVTIAGWIFSLSGQEVHYYAPTVGILVLLFGTLLIVSRNRIAHRLAMVQAYFIEPRLPELVWGRVYFAYRQRYKPFFAPVERLDHSMNFSLIGAAALELALLGWESYCGGCSIDLRLTSNFLLASALFVLQLWFTYCSGLKQFNKTEQTLYEIAIKSGLRPERRLLGQTSSDDAS